MFKWLRYAAYCLGLRREVRYLQQQISRKQAVIESRDKTIRDLREEIETYGVENRVLQVTVDALNEVITRDRERVKAEMATAILSQTATEAIRLRSAHGQHQRGE